MSDPIARNDKKKQGGGKKNKKAAASMPSRCLRAIGERHNELRRSVKRTNSRRETEHHQELPKSPTKRRNSLNIAMSMRTTSPPRATRNSKDATGFLPHQQSWSRASMPPSVTSFPSMEPLEGLKSRLSFSSSSSTEDKICGHDNIELTIDESKKDGVVVSKAMKGSPVTTPKASPSHSPITSTKAIVSSKKKSSTLTAFASPNAVVSSSIGPTTLMGNLDDEEFFPSQADFYDYDFLDRIKQPTFEEVLESWGELEEVDGAAEIRFGKQEELKYHPPNMFLEQCIKAKISAFGRTPIVRERRQIAVELIHALEDVKGFAFYQMVEPLDYDGMEAMPLPRDQVIFRVVEKIRKVLAEGSKRRAQGIENKRQRDEALLTPREKTSLDQLALLSKGQVEEAIELIHVPDFDRVREECHQYNETKLKATLARLEKVAAKQEQDSTKAASPKASPNNKVEPSSPRKTKKKADKKKKDSKRDHSGGASADKVQSSSVSPRKAKKQADKNSSAQAVDETTVDKAIATTATSTDHNGMTAFERRKAMLSNKLRKKQQVRKGKRPSSKNNGSNSDSAAAVPDTIGSTEQQHQQQRSPSMHSNRNSNHSNNNTVVVDDLLLLTEELGNCSMTSFEDDLSMMSEIQLVRTLSGGSWASGVLVNAFP